MCAQLELALLCSLLPPLPHSPHSPSVDPDSVQGLLGIMSATLPTMIMDQDSETSFIRIALDILLRANRTIVKMCVVNSVFGEILWD